LRDTWFKKIKGDRDGNQERPCCSGRRAAQQEQRRERRRTDDKRNRERDDERLAFERFFRERPGARENHAKRNQKQDDSPRNGDGLRLESEKVQ